VKRLLSISLLPLIGFVLGLIFFASRLTTYANLDSSTLDALADGWLIDGGIALLILFLLEAGRRILLEDRG
jgi:riboflavin transporter FmnP